jgi:hypothetical protein
MALMLSSTSRLEAELQWCVQPDSDGDGRDGEPWTLAEP